MRQEQGMTFATHGKMYPHFKENIKLTRQPNEQEEVHLNYTCNKVILYMKTHILKDTND